MPQNSYFHKRNLILNIISHLGPISRTELIAVTDYRVEKEGKYTLVTASPKTGRTHQLRLHMAAIGYPLVGDWLYGTEDHELISRPALHAAYLSVQHPVTGETIEYTAPLPADMKRLMEL